MEQAELDWLMVNQLSTTPIMNLIATVRERDKKLTKCERVKEQLQIAVEHWEMYEDQFVDVERKACKKARRILEADT